jgi:hypothetical protein
VARPLAGPPLGEPEADQGGGEQVEREQDVEPALVTDREPPEAGEPGQRALYHPAVPAQALGALDARAGDPGRDASPRQAPAAAVVVVALVGVQLARPLARPAGALPDRRHGVEQRLERRLSWTFAGAEQERERDAAGVDQDVALGAGLAAVGRVRAGELAPLWPGTRRCRASSGRSRSRSPGRAGRAARGGAARRPSPPASRAAGASRSCPSRGPSPWAGSPRDAGAEREHDALERLAVVEGWTAPSRAGRSLGEQRRDQRPERVGNQRSAIRPS